jgi:hypothetical protein
VLLAWLTTFPYCGPLPQSSHFIAISIPALQKIEKQSLNCSRSPQNRQTNAKYGTGVPESGLVFALRLA